VRRKNFVVIDSRTWHNARSTAKFTGFNEQYLRRLARDGKISGRKIGATENAQWFFNRPQVLKELGMAEREPRPHKLNGKHGTIDDLTSDL
jgi:hypothetical protein